MSEKQEHPMLGHDGKKILTEYMKKREPLVFENDPDNKIIPTLSESVQSLIRIKPEKLSSAALENSNFERVDNLRKELLDKLEKSGVSDYTASKIKDFVNSDLLKNNKPSVQMVEMNLMLHKLKKFGELDHENFKDKSQHLQNEMVFLASTFKIHGSESEIYMKAREGRRLALLYEVSNGADPIKKLQQLNREIINNELDMTRLDINKISPKVLTEKKGMPKI